MYDIDEIENDELQKLNRELEIENTVCSQIETDNNFDNDTDVPEQKKLKHELRAEALARLEDAARTVDEFEKVIEWWDGLDANRERKERYHEISRGDNVPIDYNAVEDGINYPRNLNHFIWQQIQKGNFLDAIFNCPYEIHELVTEPYISRIIDNLSIENKELLYYIAIRQYSTTRISKLKCQSERNIRKVRNTMLKRIQRKLYAALLDRQHMTIEEKRFVANYAILVDSNKQ